MTMMTIVLCEWQAGNQSTTARNRSLLYHARRSLKNSYTAQAHVRVRADIGPGTSETAGSWLLTDLSEVGHKLVTCCIYHVTHALSGMAQCPRGRHTRQVLAPWHTVTLCYCSQAGGPPQPSVAANDKATTQPLSTFSLLLSSS